MSRLSICASSGHLSTAQNPKQHSDNDQNCGRQVLYFGTPNLHYTDPSLRCLGCGVAKCILQLSINIDYSNLYANMHQNSIPFFHGKNME
jgi:hypothetical protein